MDPNAPLPADLERTLREHVLDVWFPRCIDEQHGGFRCDFDHAWRECGPHEKLLEFQARHTGMVSRAAAQYPEDSRLRKAADHGFAYLRDVLWDAQHGGWYHRLDRMGKPLEAETKHAHGMAYAIQAAVTYSEATGSAEGLELALRGFDWLEDCSHDAEHGGYWGLLTRSGQVIRRQEDCPWRTSLDTIACPLGFKDLNVHSDMAESLTHLYRATRSPKVATRLQEVLDHLCGRALSAYGALHYFYHADLTPLPHLVRFGYQFQTAHRLIEAGEVVGNLPHFRSVARRLVDYALRHGYQGAPGGIIYAAPGAPPLEIEGKNLQVPKKAWWVQMEALRTLYLMTHHFPEAPEYARHLATHWSYLQRHLIDSRNGGFHSVGLDMLRRWQRRYPLGQNAREITRKGGVWKDASHDGNAFLSCLQLHRSQDHLGREKTVGPAQTGQLA